jgi:RNA polymerase sigma-70 factor (ECF subfamily)
MSHVSGTLRWQAAITGQMQGRAAASETGRVLADTSAETDAQLVQRTAAGDREAFATLYRRHHATIFRFARLMTGSNAMAEDVVQEVFLALMRNAARYDGSRSALSTYLYGVARQHTRRRLFREKRFVAIEDAAIDASVAPGDIAADAERRDDVQRLRRAIVALPSRYREVVVLCDLQDVDYSDAALALGCPIGTVRSRLHRARHLLANKLNPASDPAPVSRSTMRCPV